MTNNSREGWIDHDGGPGPALSGRVEVSLRSGDCFTGSDLSDDRTWLHIWGEGDIIAYRVVTAADDRGDRYEAARGVVSPNSPDELAMAVAQLSEEFRFQSSTTAQSVDIILSRLASQEETIRADGEATRLLPCCVVESVRKRDHAAKCCLMALR